MPTLILQRLSFARSFMWYMPKRNMNFQSRNPRDPHFDRKKMLEICKPIFEPPMKPLWETCGNNSILPYPVEPHPYEKIVAKELQANWQSSSMICIFHINSMSMEEEKKIRKTFMKQNLFFHIYTDSVVKLVLENTPFRSCLHLMNAETAFVFGAETSAAQVLNLSKKMIHIVMLAAIVNGMFFSKNQLLDYSQLPTIDVLQARLCMLLDSKIANISQAIAHPSQALSQSLKQLSTKE